MPTPNNETPSLTQQLLAKPAEPLNDQEIHEVKKFAHNLFNGQLDNLKVPIKQTLGEIYNIQTKSHAQLFCLEYFVDATGRDDAITLGLKKHGSFEERGDYLRATAITQHDPEEHKVIAQRSNQWRRYYLARLLQKDAQYDDQFQPLHYTSINYQPGIFLNRIQGLVAYQQFYQAVAEKLSGTSRMERAKQALLTIHQRRVNSLLSDEYLSLESLQAQLRRKTLTPEEHNWLEQVEHLLPHINNLRTDNDIPTELSLIESFLSQTSTDWPTRDAIEPAALTTLDSTYWNAKQLKEFLEKLLESWGLLSKEKSSWIEIDRRSGRAADGLFQVVIRPTKSSLAVSSAKRALFVPHDFKRLLISFYPAGCLPVAAHELTHVLQAVADDSLGQIIPLACIKGARYRASREAGAVYQETIVHERYFGRTRPVNMHYARAIAVKLRGGTQLSVIRAFYDSYRAKNPEAVNAALLAVDRALRLYRHNEYNTASGIVEQARLLEQLHDLTQLEAMQFAFAGSSFSPNDALLLRHFGLLQFPSQLVCQPARDVVWLYTSEFLS